MAARSLFKLFNKSYLYSLNSTYPKSKISSLCGNDGYRKHSRSCSQPPQKHNNNINRTKHICRSLVNLRDNRYKDENTFQEAVEENEHSLQFTLRTDMSFRDPGKELNEKISLKEKNEDKNPIYEVSDGTRLSTRFFDIYKSKIEKKQNEHLFLHLQPNAIKPYGSNSNTFMPNMTKKRFEIVYPVTAATTVTTTNQYIQKKDNIQIKDINRSKSKKQYPGYEKVNKLAVCEKKTLKKDYSTSCAKKSSTKMFTPNLNIRKSFTRKSSTALLKKQKGESKYSHFNEILEVATRKIVNQFHQEFNQYKTRNKIQESLVSFLSKSRQNTNNIKRSYTNINAKSLEKSCSEFVTVKLSDLQEECRQVKKCKPEKIKFGRLPRLVSADCPCIENFILKEGNPIQRLKKRATVKPKIKDCGKEVPCSSIRRADDNYTMKKKSLPPLTLRDCVCEEREMTDFVIRRLPKKKIPDPIRTESCEEIKCTIPRADEDLKILEKRLPLLEQNQCPCYEQPPLKDVPLQRLDAKKVKEPERVCPQGEKCEPQYRADSSIQIKRKVLPVLKPSCDCVEQLPMKDSLPLPRMKKVKYIDPPRPVCEEKKCEEILRADYNWTMKKKKLHVFVPQNCPCIEQEIPNKSFVLKKLEFKTLPKPKEVVCIEEKCNTSRADDGIVIKRKTLQVFKLKPCPCIEEVLKDSPPLKKLVPKPVQEPAKICKIEVVCQDVTDRADGNIKVENKQLPILGPGSCACVDTEPMKEIPPLPKLNKRPVFEKEVCKPKVLICDETERADENLIVQIKTLPKLEVNDCPCLNPTPQDNVKPLPRLKKVHVSEPPKVCPKVDFCDEISRADEDDWLYWKQVEVKKTDSDPNRKTSKIGESNKRMYSSFAELHQKCFTRSYSNEIFREKDLPLMTNINLALSVAPNCLKNKKIIDCVTLVICKSDQTLKNTNSKNSIDSMLVPFNNIPSRSVSTCSTTLSEKSGKDCECSRDTRDLQPNKNLIPEKEKFITPYPDDKFIERSVRKSRDYYKTRNVDDDKTLECVVEEEHVSEADVSLGEVEENLTKKVKQMSLWERVVNYFKARPGCPSPEEFKRMRLKDAAERAAQKAGLCVYDPKEMLKKIETELPKVITPESSKSCQK